MTMRGAAGAGVGAGVGGAVCLASVLVTGLAGRARARVAVVA